MKSTEKNFNNKSHSTQDRHKIVGATRNAFGTRLCQRVVCDKCKKVDYVSVRIAAGKDALCRDCAEKVLGAFEQGRLIKDKKVGKVCVQCGQNFLVAESISKKKNQLRCLDCYRGFEVWRRKITIANEEVIKNTQALPLK